MTDNTPYVPDPSEFASMFLGVAMNLKERQKQQEADYVDVSKFITMNDRDNDFDITKRSSMHFLGHDAPNGYDILPAVDLGGLANTDKNGYDMFMQVDGRIVPAELKSTSLSPTDRNNEYCLDVMSRLCKRVASGDSFTLVPLEQALTISFKIKTHSTMMLKHCDCYLYLFDGDARSDVIQIWKVAGDRILAFLEERLNFDSKGRLKGGSGAVSVPLQFFIDNGYVVPPMSSKQYGWENALRVLREHCDYDFRTDQPGQKNGEQFIKYLAPALDKETNETFKQLLEHRGPTDSETKFAINKLLTERGLDTSRVIMTVVNKTKDGKRMYFMSGALQKKGKPGDVLMMLMYEDISQKTYMAVVPHHEYVTTYNGRLYLNQADGTYAPRPRQSKRGDTLEMYNFLVKDVHDALETIEVYLNEEAPASDK